jgi:hypothetical protein
VKLFFEKMKSKFDLNSIQISDIKPINPEFSKCKVYIMYTGKNRNYTMFDKEVVENALYTLKGIPIIGNYSETVEDFLGHGGKLEISDEGIKYIEMTKPFGYVPEDATFSWENIQEADGSTHQYLVADNCILWTGRYPEANKVIETGTGQSMEININDGMYTDDDYLNVKAFTFSALCLLGEKFEPCFEGAKAVGYTFNKDDFESEYQEMLEKIKQFSFDSSNKNNKNNKEEKIMDKLALFEKYSNLTDEDTKVLRNNLDKYTVEELDIELMKLSYSKMEKEFAGKDSIISGLKDDIKIKDDTIFKLNTQLKDANDKYVTLEATNTSLKETNDKYESEKLVAEKEAVFEKFSKALTEEEMKEVKDNMNDFTIDEISNKLNSIFTTKVLEGIKDDKEPIDTGKLDLLKNLKVIADMLSNFNKGK